MSNPMVHAFFIGRALAAAIGERVEHLMTDSLSALGRFDAEQRENLRQFTEEVCGTGSARGGSSHEQSSYG